MSKVVLSAATGDLSVVDGVNGTVVVAAETAGTAAVVLPGGCTVERDVAHGTFFGASSAVGANVAVDSKLPVGYHETVEVGADHVGECPGHQSQLELTVASLPSFHHFHKPLQVFLCLSNLGTFALGLVGIHKRQADVALGHDERLAAVQGDAPLSQFLCQHRDRQSRTVATGTQRVGIVPCSPCNCHLANELTDDMRRLPSVNGEAEAYALVVRQ